MNSWLLAFAVLPLVGWILVRPMQNNVLPEMIRDGNEQILAQWRDALLAYKADQGQFPTRDPDLSLEASVYDALTGNNKSQKEYLDRSSVRVLSGTLPIDAWDTRLAFDPQKEGDMAHVVSAGPDLTFGTEDDMDSRQAKQRNIPIPMEAMDERTRRKVEAAKTDAAKETKAAEKASKPEPKTP